MNADTNQTNPGKEARFLIVKLNNLAHRLQQEGGLMVSDYTEGIIRNPHRPAHGQVKALQALSFMRCPNATATLIAQEIQDTADRLLQVTGWQSTHRPAVHHPPCSVPKPRKHGILSRIHRPRTARAAAVITAACA